jgi:protein-arginine kinase activator protein McsA
MTTHLDDLKERMEEAVAAQDFETAGKLRDQIDDALRDNRVRAVELRATSTHYHRAKSASR